MKGLRVGRLQRDPRPAAAEDVAAHRPRARSRAASASPPTAGARGRRRTRGWRRARSRTCSSIRRARAGARTLYATAFGRGVYKSTDNGRTWTLKNAGLEQRQPFAWRITRADDGTLYLVVARRSERGRIGDADDGALYRSTDGAEHWTRMALPAGHQRARTASPSIPRDPRRLYLAAWGVATARRRHRRRDLPHHRRGRDLDATCCRESQHVYDVTVDPRDPAVLYASGFDQAAYRSADRGATWTRLRGFNFKWGHRVVPDRGRPAKVYVTTFGGSVWHGPADGRSAPRVEDRRAARAREPRSSSSWRRTSPASHAFQVKLARKSGKGDPACWRERPDRRRRSTRWSRTRRRSSPRTPRP